MAATQLLTSATSQLLTGFRSSDLIWSFSLSDSLAWADVGRETSLRRSGLEWSVCGAAMSSWLGPAGSVTPGGAAEEGLSLLADPGRVLFLARSSCTVLWYKW